MATTLAPHGLEIFIRIYLTGDTAFQEWDNVSVSDETHEKSHVPSLLEDPAVQITRGSRPNLEQILQQEADLTDGRMVVTGSFCLSPINPYTLLTVIQMPSVRVSICHCRRQGCPRIFNRWAVQHHEGWSQYHPQH